MLDTLRRTYANVFLKPYLTWYLKKERKDTVRGFRLVIRPTVFHPNFFFSSLWLFDFVNSLNLSRKQFLEIGCGSGLISLLAHQKNALVTACDINPVAVECTQLNFEENFPEQLKDITIVKSDVFDSIPHREFDAIVINPPYFFEDVKSAEQLAWYCGKNGEYFSKLFSGLRNFINLESEIYMVLAENCDIERIQNIAESHQFYFELVVHKKIRWERNFIFKIRPI